jgi:hypothetical protein
MFPKEIPMICLGRKVYQRSRNVPNLKEVIIDLKCLFLYQNFIQGDLRLLVSEEERFVDIVKVLEMKKANYINANHVVVQAR